MILVLVILCIEPREDPLLIEPSVVFLHYSLIRDFRGT